MINHVHDTYSVSIDNEILLLTGDEELAWRVANESMWSGQVQRALIVRSGPQSAVAIAALIAAAQNQKIASQP